MYLLTHTLYTYSPFGAIASRGKPRSIDPFPIKVIVPTQKQASKKEPKEFDKEHFKYDTEKDSYICPEGH